MEKLHIYFIRIVSVIIIKFVYIYRSFKPYKTLCFMIFYDIQIVYDDIQIDEYILRLFTSFRSANE
jgi:hypothetical protein